MKRNKIIYRTVTALLSLMMVMSAGMYFFNYQEVAAIFTSLGFPTFIIYPLAVAKIVGIIAIWTRFSTSLVYFAYAGYLFNFLLAASAHMMINDGEHVGAIVALVLWLVSFVYYRKLYA